MSDNQNTPTNPSSNVTSLAITPVGIGHSSVRPTGNQFAGIPAQVSEQAKGLSPQQLETVKQSYRSAGFSDQEIFNAFSNPGSPHAGNSIANSIDLDDAEINSARLFPELQGQLSDERTKAALENLINHWTGPKEDLLTALNRAGVVRTQVPSATSTAPKIDPAIDPPESSADYKLSFASLPDMGRLETQTVAEVDQEIRTGFHAAGIANAVANETANEGMKTVISLVGATPEQIAEHTENLHATLKSVLGQERYEQAIVRANLAFQRMPEEIREPMRQSHFTKNIRVILSLAQAWERFSTGNPGAAKAHAAKVESNSGQI